MPNIFESINNTSDKAVDICEKYIKDTQDYFKLKVFQQLSISLSMIAKVLAIGGLLFIGLIFLAFAAAFAIGDALGNVALGHVIIAAFFLLLSALAYLKRALINRLIISKLSGKFFDL